MIGPGQSGCACNTGYSGDGTTCTAVNSCLTANGGCDPTAICTTTGPGTNTCACAAGYTGNGMTCTAIDECSMEGGGCCSVTAIEPSPENARMARLNLQRNRVAAEVIEAAVGPHDGTARFEDAGDSNLGHLGATTEGRLVTVLSMETVLRRLPVGAEADLVKMDIEGGEGPLLQENLGWLKRVRSIIAEFHPTIIDYPAAIKSIEAQGFRYFPAHSAADFDSMDAFMQNHRMTGRPRCPPQGRRASRHSRRGRGMAGADLS